MLRTHHYKTLGILIGITTLLLMPASGLFASDSKQATLKTGIISEIKEMQGFKYSADGDNFLRRLLGISNKPKSRSDAKSRSKPHKTSQTKRYSPPESNSKKPTSYDGNSVTKVSSNSTSVRNTPKPPLQKSRREQYQSLGIWEMGFSFGTSHAISDIAGNKGFGVGDFASYHSSNFGFGAGIYGRYLMNDWFAVNMGMNFANLSATREIDLADFEVYSFNNDIFEFFAKSEFRLPQLARTPFDLYAFMGIGVFFSDARIYDQNDRLISTQDDYSQVQPFIPFGGGFSVKITHNFKLGYELGWRNTIFHYLDGVKMNNNYDNYFLNSIKVGLVF